VRKRAQPPCCVTSVTADCPGWLGGRRGWRQISVALWYPGLHTCYNGRYNGLLKRELEPIPSKPSPVQIGGCNLPPWSRNR